MPKNKIVAIIYKEDDDGDEVEVEVEFPSKMEVCPRCEGRGKHDHPAFSNGITSDEWEQDWDEDSREGYLAGRYDVVCEECHGANVVAEVDEDALTPEQRADFDLWCEQDRERAAWRRDERRAREMGY